MILKLRKYMKNNLNEIFLRKRVFIMVKTLYRFFIRVVLIFLAIAFLLFALQLILKWIGIQVTTVQMLGFIKKCGLMFYSFIKEVIINIKSVFFSK